MDQTVPVGNAMDSTRVAEPVASIATRAAVLLLQLANTILSHMQTKVPHENTATPVSLCWKLRQRYQLQLGRDDAQTAGWHFQSVWQENICTVCRRSVRVYSVLLVHSVAKADRVY